MNIKHVFTFICLSFLLFTMSAQAHRLGESYVYLEITDQEITGRFEVTLEHLNKAINMDADGDGKLTNKEYLQVAQAVNQYMEKTLTFHQEGSSLPISVTGNQEILLETPVGDFARINFVIPGLQGVPDDIQATYQFLFGDIDPEHRGFVVIENNSLTGIKDQEANVVALFGPGDNVEKNIRLAPLEWYQTVGVFIGHGVWHILIGYDHILFIISLLLPSVMIVTAAGRKPVSNFSQAMWAVVTIITLFTLSHSISLSLAALDIVRLPSRLVESFIALSIAIAALNNMFPIFNKRMGLVVFIFGLFHGFGFANVLEPLHIETGSLAASLFGFNLGVELGQLAIICLVFPFLFLIRNWNQYNFVILRLGSIGLIAISMMWFVKRAFGI